MLGARRLDEFEREYVNRGFAFFHVSSAGHEALTVFPRHLIPADFLHCHYRDKALMLARGVPLVQFFHSVLCNVASHSVGRQMSAHFCDRSRNVLSIVGPVGNQALQAVGVAAEIAGRAGEPIVVCSMGDGTSQQGEVLEAIAEAVRWELPVLFVVQDNRYSISTRTRGKTFFALPDGARPDSFYGLPLRRVDGRDALKMDETFGIVVSQMRRDRNPAIVIMDVERLSDHTNADDETVYRSSEEIAAARASGDPIVILRRKLIEAGVGESELEKIEREVREEVRAAAEEALAAPEPATVFTAKRELTGGKEGLTTEARRTRREIQTVDASRSECQVIPLREDLESSSAPPCPPCLRGEDSSVSQPQNVGDAGESRPTTSEAIGEDVRAASEEKKLTTEARRTRREIPGFNGPRSECQVIPLPEDSESSSAPPCPPCLRGEKSSVSQPESVGNSSEPRLTMADAIREEARAVAEEEGLTTEARRARREIQPLNASQSDGEVDPFPEDSESSSAPPCPPCLRGESSSVSLTMAEAIRETLRVRMKADDRVTLYGEDIEDPKGDVFGVTKGLTVAYPGRVRNSPVSESTIVGTSIGRALAGGRPVAFIQFADFLPLAFNQIATEMGSIYWRTNGAWECPVIVMIACGGYRPGLGPFHSHTLESVACHVPGVDVVMVSDAEDAVGALNSAFESGRPTLFFYPKALLNDPDLGTLVDVEQLGCGVGRSRKRREGNDITFVAWGNTVGLCEKAADALMTVGMSADVIDLRWLSPWDESAVCESARKTGKLIVVHEDNHTCGFGAEVVATVAETCGPAVRCRRVTRPDVYLPCNFANQLEVLPSYERVLTTAAEMLDLELTWEVPAPDAEGITTIRATGSSPSDESTIIVSFKWVVGQRIAEGDLVACLDCDKALFDLASPVSGTIERVYVKPGQTIRVGTPMVDVRTEDAGRRTKRVTREEPGTPRLKRR